MLRETDSMTTGRGRRIADILTAEGHRDQVTRTHPINIPLRGQRLFQTAGFSIPYTMGPSDPAELSGPEGDGTLTMHCSTAFDRALSRRHATAYEGEFAATQQRALDLAKFVSDAPANLRSPNSPAFRAPFPPSSLSLQLRTAAEIIAVRERLSATRQMFFVATGGFDTHSNQLSTHPALLSDLSKYLNVPMPRWWNSASRNA